jgi:hypothetical protein
MLALTNRYQQLHSVLFQAAMHSAFYSLEQKFSTLIVAILLEKYGCNVQVKEDAAEIVWVGGDNPFRLMSDTKSYEF